MRQMIFKHDGVIDGRSRAGTKPPGRRFKTIRKYRDIEGVEMNQTLIRQRAKIPKHVLNLFWEYPKKELSWSKDAELIIRKVLESGGWDSAKWLLATTGHAWLKNWMIQRRGAGLDPKRLRFWQLALNLPEADVTLWITEQESNPWQQRLGR